MNVNKIILKSGHQEIGAAKNLIIDQQKNTQTLKTLTGNTQLSMPGKSTISCKMNLVRFNSEFIKSHFARNRIYSGTQIQPFDITVETADESGHVSENGFKIEDCWITGIYETYQSDEFVIAKDVKIEACSISEIENLTEDEWIVRDIIL